jgi:glycosyltransferase involved in cell wall biosynthesis
MCRVLPKFYIPKRAFHVGNIPQLPHHTWVKTSVRIKHFGQMRKEDRERKYIFYSNNDLVKDPKLVGNADYSHVKDETHAVIEPWVENNSISFATIMKNEETNLHNFFNQYWAFADEIVLVDTGSTDNSVELAEMWGAKVLHTEWKENFSDPRNMALKACKEDWIFHVDIDEDVPELGKLRRMTELQSAAGFIFYINNLQPNGKSALSETIRLMRNNGQWYYTGYVHETVDKAAQNSKLKIFRATTGITHKGFLKPRDKMKEKLKKYLRMNLRQLRDNPMDESACYNTAMHFLEAGFEEAGKYLLEKAASLNNKFMQPISELAGIHTKKAHDCYKYLVNILPEEHAMVNFYKQAVQSLGPLKEERDPIDQTHVAEVLQEPEFIEMGKMLAQISERKS